MKVLVIGGGLGGLTACTSLRKFDRYVDITLVEPKDYIEIPWASYRSIFDKDLAMQSTFDLEKWAVPKSVKVVKSTVTKLSENDATLANGNIIEFNVAVICTGAQTRFPALGRGPPSGKKSVKGSGERQRRLAQLESEGNRLLESKSVLIVGGGLIGIEFAGDLAYFAKQKGKTIHITLVHSKNQLGSEELTPKAAAMTQKKLENLGVVVLLNEKAVKEGERVLLQNSKKPVQAEKIVWTTGIYPCNSFLDSKYLDRRGWIEVDDYFRVKGAEGSLYALGDCCDLLPNSGAQILGTMGVIGKNITVTLDSIQSGVTENVEKKMRKALVQPATYVTTIGKQTGVAQTPCCYTQLILPWAKNSTMFLFKPKGELGLKS